MKLAFCLFKYFPYGGLQRDFMRIAQLCAARGHEVHVYTMEWVGPHPANIIIHEQKPTAFALQNHSRVDAFTTSIQAALKNQYDVIIGFNKMPGLDLYYAADGCFEAKINAKKFSSITRLLPRNKVYSRLEKAVYHPHTRTHVLYISKKNQSDYQQYYALPSSQQSLLPPGIDRHFQTVPEKKSVSNALRKQLQLDNNKLLLLMVASSFKTKGLDRALKALAALPLSLQEKVEFNVIGHDNRTPFRHLAKKVGLKTIVHYRGAQDNIADWMQASDLLIHPAYEESAGLTLLEAIASGLPIITTAACGYADYISAANAGIVMPEPFSQDAFNHTLHDLLLAPTKLSTYSEQAQCFAKTADFYSMPEAAVTIIEQWERNHARS